MLQLAPAFFLYGITVHINLDIRPVVVKLAFFIFEWTKLFRLLDSHKIIAVSYTVQQIKNALSKSKQYFVCAVVLF